MATGAFHKIQEQLFNQGTTNESVDGTSFLLSSSRYDAITDTEQSFKAAIKLTVDGGTDPTAMVRVQTSPNGVDWFTAVDSTQLSSAGGIEEIKDIETLFKYVRCQLVLGGTVLPNATASVHLVSNGNFNAEAQS